MGIREYFSINIGDFTWGITETHISVIIITISLIIFAIYTNKKIKSFKDEPTGFQNFIEWLVETFDNFTYNTMGDKGRPFASYFAVLFIFIFISNISGLFGLRSPTADYSTTFSLAMITFFMVQYFGVKSKGVGGYLKSFTEPIPLMMPLNVIGELANPISLSFRLFGNVLGGTILISLYYQIPYKLIRVAIPTAMHFYFDLFSGVLQAFVFTMLSMVFISGSLE